MIHDKQLIPTNITGERENVWVIQKVVYNYLSRTKIDKHDTKSHFREINMYVVDRALRFKKINNDF